MPRCWACFGMLDAVCARCGGEACRTCDLCHGCGRVLCDRCNSEPTPRYECRPGLVPHPHSVTLEPEEC